MVSYTKDDFGWRGRWIAWRNRVMMDPRFQNFATRFVLTRPIARRRARTLFDLVAGFTYSQILAAVVETRLLQLLFDGPLDTATIATRCDLPDDGARCLLRAAAALGLVEPLGECWALGSDGAALLGNRGIVEMVAHHHLLYADLADPVALLRRGGGGGRLSDLWRYAESPGLERDDKKWEPVFVENHATNKEPDHHGVSQKSPDDLGDGAAVSAYSALMAASQPMVAAQAIAAYPFHRHRRLLDVGGGEGAFLSAVGAAVPAIELALFDLPAVCERARARFVTAGLADRSTVHGGNFLTDSLPPGCDIISLIRVLHDHDDAPAMVLLRSIHAALPPGGTLFIAEPMARTPGAEPAGDAYFGFYLLAMGSGRPRSPDEIAAMLRAAGFSRSRLVPTAVPLTARIMVATR